MNLKLLAEPFFAHDIEWRVSRAGQTRDGRLWCRVLAYVDNRAIQSRLDEVVGPAHWKNEFQKAPDGGVLCGISIYFADRGEWITKWDGAENTQFEAVKGGLSGSMKRAAVQWGIGRYLYRLDEGFAEIREDGQYHSNSKIRVNGKEEWASFRWNPPGLPDWALPAPAHATPAQVAPVQETQGNGAQGHGAIGHDAPAAPFVSASVAQIAGPSAPVATTSEVGAPPAIVAEAPATPRCKANRQTKKTPAMAG